MWLEWGNTKGTVVECQVRKGIGARSCGSLWGHCKDTDFTPDKMGVIGGVELETNMI